MRVILDTGALFHPAVIYRARDERRALVLPAVAYAERRRQLLTAGRRFEEYDRLLDEARIEVEPFTRTEADRIPGLPNAAWGRLARDAMIAAHVRPGDQLWTTNPNDFLALGLSREEVLDVRNPPQS